MFEPTTQKRSNHESSFSSNHSPLGRFCERVTLRHLGALQLLLLLCVHLLRSKKRRDGTIQELFCPVSNGVWGTLRVILANCLGIVSDKRDHRSLLTNQDFMECKKTCFSLLIFICGCEVGERRKFGNSGS